LSYRPTSNYQGIKIGVYLPPRPPLAFASLPYLATHCQAIHKIRLMLINVKVTASHSPF